MKLAAVFIVWHDWDLLHYAVENIRPLVDEVIIIGSTRSNHGELSEIPKQWHNRELFIREPRFHVPMHSETDKRNYGLGIARDHGNTHFIMMDSDEFYKPDEFLKAKERFSNPFLNGLVCPVVVYFKSPSLCLGRDITLVPHIHKLTKTIHHEFNRHYPFAWSGKQIRIDPTRSLSITSGVEYTEEIEMHHYSWVRKDYALKIRNSTARANIEKSTLREDYAAADKGVYCKYYQAVLTECPNYFGIEILPSQNPS